MQFFFALSERVDPFILNFLYRSKTRYTSLYINFFSIYSHNFSARWERTHSFGQSRHQRIAFPSIIITAPLLELIRRDTCTSRFAFKTDFVFANLMSPESWKREVGTGDNIHALMQFAMWFDPKKLSTLYEHKLPQYWKLECGQDEFPSFQTSAYVLALIQSCGNYLEKFPRKSACKWSSQSPSLSALMYNVI